MNIKSSQILTKILASMMLLVSAYGAAASIQMSKINPALVQDWEVLYSDPKFRNLALHFADTKTSPQWTDILEDAGRRYGIAFLLNMEDKQIVLARANEGLLNPGVHYLQPSRLDQSQRYQWPVHFSEGLTERSQYAFNLKVEREEAQREADRQVKKEIDRRVLTTRQQLEESQKRQTEAYLAKLEQLNKEKMRLANIQKQLAKRQEEVEAAKRNNEIQTAQQQAQEKVLVAEREVLLRKQKTLDAQIQQQELITNNLKNKYYPSDDRFIPKGSAEPAIRDFLQKHWKYGLVWSDEAVKDIWFDEVKFLNTLRFNENDLYKDVSDIVCTLTRDNAGISFYADIDTASRAVYLQLHAVSEDVRQRLIDTCFK